jgi:hypothetical protein
MIRIAALASSALMLASCANQGGLSPAQRNTGIGAATGAAVGAAVAGDEATGAVIGGLAGAAIGAYTGCRQQGGCYVGGREVDTEPRYDDSTGRNYFYDPASGNTYYANGDLRSQGSPQNNY